MEFHNSQLYSKQILYMQSREKNSVGSFNR